MKSVTFVASLVDGNPIANGVYSGSHPVSRRACSAFYRHQMPISQTSRWDPASVPGFDLRRHFAVHNLE